LHKEGPSDRGLRTDMKHDRPAHARIRIRAYGCPICKAEVMIDMRWVLDTLWVVCLTEV
jgi:hypothetical protein